MKRKDVLTWDEYFMGLAHLSAKRSKDPSTQVGAVIVSKEHRVVGMGFLMAVVMMNFHGIVMENFHRPNIHSSFMRN